MTKEDIERFMKHLAILLVALLSTLNISATWANVGGKNIQTVTTDSLRTADLLFVLNPKGNAITEVTEGVDHMPIDHVGIVFRSADGLFVMEATAAQGVTFTLLSSFIKRNHQPNLISSVVVGRPRKDVDLINGNAIEAYLTTLSTCPMIKRCTVVNWCRKCYTTTMASLSTVLFLCRFTTSMAR